MVQKTEVVDVSMITGDIHRVLCDMRHATCYWGRNILYWRANKALMQYFVRTGFKAELELALARCEGLEEIRSLHAFMMNDIIFMRASKRSVSLSHAKTGDELDTKLRDIGIKDFVGSIIYKEIC